VRLFDEINAAQGALGTVRERELMYLILNHLDRAKLKGLMDTPVDQPFWPGDYDPFTLK
jgi:2,3-bisphosphoglycerate-independent phosphoglycerate mutase